MRDAVPVPTVEACVSASIEDVARRAGVSVATVSRALRDLPNVAPATRERVRRAARELNYVAHPHAARLAARQSATVGIVVPTLGPWYYAQFLMGAERTLAQQHYDILPFPLPTVEAIDRFLRVKPYRKRVDALIVVDLPFDARDFDELRTGDLPIVSVGTYSPGSPAVGIDNVAAAATATRHLVNLGHRSIGLIGVTSDEGMQFTTPTERREGYLAALAQAGIDPRPELQVPGESTYRSGAEAMATLLSIGAPPTAVFAMSDELAIGAMKTIRDTGRRIPEDVSVVGFDDNEVAEFVGLTTVRQDVSTQASLAAEMALAGLRGVPIPNEKLNHPTNLVVRRTTGPAPY